MECTQTKAILWFSSYNKPYALQKMSILMPVNAVQSTKKSKHNLSMFHVTFDSIKNPWNDLPFLMMNFIEKLIQILAYV